MAAIVDEYVGDSSFLDGNVDSNGVSLNKQSVQEIHKSPEFIQDKNFGLKGIFLIDNGLIFLLIIFAIGSYFSYGWIRKFSARSEHMSDNPKTKFSERLNLWNNMDENSNEKIKFLSKFNGDKELAKWAFIREVDKENTKATMPLKNLLLVAETSFPDPIKKILSGDFSFWGGFFLLVIFPNLIFKVLIANGDLNGEDLRYALAFYLLFSIIAVGLLFIAALRMLKENKKFSRIAIGLVALSAISIIYNGPTALEAITKVTTEEKIQRWKKSIEKNFDGSSSGFGSSGFGSSK